jgi:hypothetical protein
MDLMPILEAIKDYTRNINKVYLQNISDGFNNGPIYGWHYDEDIRSIVYYDSWQSVHEDDTPKKYIGKIPKGAILPYVPYYEVKYKKDNGHIIITDMIEKKDKIIYELYLGLD